MPDSSGPWDGAPWAEADWYRTMGMEVRSGIQTQGLSVLTATDGPLAWAATGLTLTPAAGRATVRGAGYVRTAALTSVAATANTHASFSRRDRLVLRRSLATHTVSLAVIAGTAASTPVAPAVTRDDTTWDLTLFSFLVPPASGTTITGIVDERVWLQDETSPAFGKMWRTSGFSGSITATSLVVVAMEAARVSGGFSFINPGSINPATPPALVLPASGMYRVTNRAYATGASGYEATSYTNRTRSGAPDLTIQANGFDKSSANDRTPVWTDVVPLATGDKLWCQYSPSVTGANYWGTSEYAGVMLSAEYLGPLNGATPI